MATSFSGGASRSTGENHRPVQATGKLYRGLQVGAHFCNLQRLGALHAVLVIGLYELLKSRLTH
ncbi:MAG: hypothetical protein H0A75_05190 [Candidatus Methanofishera endochildressiae]|uniref:Uncharacterized protein n=1 Tax=Candidatus Methanofishera endochildressiae TaxID=2738884 RepID=A0A7Z0SF71_9GAMM|nr:hypothetical protein [Candidatus Methanofishera endochildressiae]